MWDKRYAEEELAYGCEPNDFLCEVAGQLPEGPALCLAEGQGRNAVFLARGGRSVTAVDLSPVGLERAAQLAAEAGVSLETEIADLAHFEIAPVAWSVVVSIWAHVPSEVRRGLHRRVVSGLRPGGVLVLEAYTPDQIGRGTGGPPNPDFTMTLAGLREELAGLEFEIARERVRTVHEGRYHNGESAVVQVLARKPS
ncbi:class I SAM-dependent methyltransferase [Pseudenhygromyxa sp. WMMC2535]|uniref:SAM-dependent methyltransferase n=1 Tax=Pseudenhygromyxa sp. WMMC2535 TaxID=2712867 RepID=UPI001555D3DB|nr:class I SAM-dependent methyltransferase [Pseudenhygromyxa sp. WMMC2535]NVB37005.1 class I SAM-dependent methyltransferase [Pseudenhygromyxa sp. WMMC2535]